MAVFLLVTSRGGALVEGGEVGGCKKLLRALLQVPATSHVLCGLFALFRTWLQGQVATDPVGYFVSPLVHLAVKNIMFFKLMFF